MNSIRWFRFRIVALALVLLCAGALTAAATDGIYYKFGLDLGYAGGPESNPLNHKWSIFTYGARTSRKHGSALDISANARIPDQVSGDVALAGAYSDLSVSDFGSISGDRYEQTTSAEFFKDHPTFTGARKSSNSINSSLNRGVASLRDVSLKAAGLNATARSPKTINTTKNLIFDNTAFSGKYVMKLTDFVLSKNATITLKGAANSSFVINVSNDFRLRDSSSVILIGGLTPSDVLFNVMGGKSETHFEIKDKARLSGTLLAYNSALNGVQRAFDISDSAYLDGQVLAASVKIKDKAKIHKRPKGSQ